MSEPDPNFTRFAATGEAAAFRAMVEEHLPMVQAVAWRRLGAHAHLAADVSQAVFTRLARVARGLPRDLILAAWLHRQALRLAIDTVRSETRRRLRESAAAAMLQSSRDDAADSPVPPPAWQQIAPLLDEAMDRLPEADRAALVLRFLEDRDFAAVGSALKTSPEAARKRVSRGLEKLRLLLSRGGVALPSAAVLSAWLAQNHAQAQAHFLTTAASASAAKLSAAAISKTALTAAASTTKAASSAAALTTFLMSHLTSAGAGAALMLLAAGLFYQHQETEINRRLSAVAAPVSGAAVAASRGKALPGRPGPGSFSQADEEDGPGTLAEIISALEIITTGPDGRLASLRIAALLRKIPPAQYLEFYITAENRLPRPRWLAIVKQSISEWSPVDPGALCMALFDSDSAKKDLLRESKVQSSLDLNSLSLVYRTEGGEMLMRRYPQPFQAWLRRDLPAAVQWVEKNAGTPMLQFSLSMRGKNTLSENLLEMAAGQLSPGASPDIIKTLGGVPGNVELYRAWAAGQLREGRTFEEIIAQVSAPLEVRALSAQLALKYPDALRSWVRAAPADSPVRFDAALGLVGAPALESPDGNSMRTLEGSEYRKRAVFALENSGAVSRREALEKIASTWVGTTSEGMDELRAWVKESGSPGDTQSALETAARLLPQKWRTVSGAMPEAMALAGDLTDPARRDPLLRGIFLRWQDTDPAAAATFLTTAPPAAAAALEAVITAEQP